MGILLELTAGPLSGLAYDLAVSECPDGTTPPAIIWLSLEASRDDEAPMVISLAAEALDMVGRRARDGGLGWVPYERADEPPTWGEQPVWRYVWAEWIPPALVAQPAPDQVPVYA